MKAIVKGLDLSNAVLKVVKAVSAKTPNQILEGIKITCKGDNLILLATDMEIAIEKTIRAETFMEGEIVVQGRLFAEFTKKLENEDDIELTLCEDKRLKITYGQAEGYIQTMSSEDFPVLKKDINKNSFTLKQKEFKDIVNKTSFACSTDDSRPILKGCLLEVEGDVLTCVALDGFRLAIAKKNVRDVFGSIKAIVPSRALVEITRLIENEEDYITVIIQDNSLLVNIDNTIFMTRLLEGNYIDYKKIVPNKFETVFRANKNLLFNAIERASIVAKSIKNRIKFEIKENYLNVLSSSEIGNVNESVIINLEGKDLNILFNSKYLIDTLRVIDDEFINFHLTSPISPCVIKPYGEEDQDYLYLFLKTTRF